MSSLCTSHTSLSASDSEDIDDSLSSQFKDFHLMTKEEIIEAIESCKKVIVEGDNLSERKSLVRKLVDLRYQLTQLNDTGSLKKPSEINISGHSFRIVKQSKRVFCDFCSNCIWIFQQNYVCVNCFYAAHGRCVNHVERVCSHVIVCEKGVPEYRICPEIGLALQKYRCAECNVLFLNKQCFVEPRKCNYSGLYYCKSCHWMNYSIIPSHIVHNWNFEQRPVSRQALQEINLFYERPVIKLEELNPKLFIFNQKLGAIKAKRMQLIEIKRYLDVCKFALSEKLINVVMGGRRYLIESTEFYSIYDLVGVENASLEEYLKGAINAFKAHVVKCEICRGHGFICELCGNKEPVYPFNEGVYKCESCGACFHRACITGLRKGCPRCNRINDKKRKSEEIGEEIS